MIIIEVKSLDYDYNAIISKPKICDYDYRAITQFDYDYSKSATHPFFFTLLQTCSTYKVYSKILIKRINFFFFSSDERVAKT